MRGNTIPSPKNHYYFIMSLRGYRPGFYKDLEVLKEAEEALWDTGKMILTHPGSWKDIYGLGIAGTKHMLRGSSTRTTQSLPASQPSTLPIEQNNIDTSSNMKRARTSTGSSITTLSGSTYGALPDVDSFKGVKRKDKSKKRIGNWKYQPFSIRQYFDILFPKWTHIEGFHESTGSVSTIDSSAGQQGVLANVTNILCQHFGRPYLMKMYSKMCYSGLSILSNHIGGAAGYHDAGYVNLSADAHGNPTTTQTQILPDLVAEDVSIKFTIQNTGKMPQTITIIEYLTKTDHYDQSPDKLWTKDIKDARPRPEGVFDPIYTQIISVNTPQQRPNPRGKQLSAYYTETRKTVYDVPASGTIQHNCYYEGLRISCADLYKADVTEGITTFTDNHNMADVTRCFMFITQGMQGHDADALLGNKIAIAPSYWNIMFTRKATWRCTPNQKTATTQRSFITGLAAWSTDMTLYDNMQKPTGTVNWRDDDGDLIATGNDDS